MQFIVTGAPRSGTAFFASLLGWAHERSYGLDTAGPALEPEVSWLAAPHVTRESALVLHLVREPTATIRSIAAVGFLNADNDYGRYAYRFVQTYDPWLFWLRWTELASRVAFATIRLEDIAELGPPINAGPSTSDVPDPTQMRDAVLQAARYYGYP